MRNLGPRASRPPFLCQRSGRDARGPSFARPTVATALALIIAGAASAQQPPRIWDVQLPSPVSDLPEEEFVDPVCGTNGGPPGLTLGSFERFERCRADAAGLREIWFR